MNLQVTRAAPSSDFEISHHKAEQFTQAMEAVWQLEAPPQAKQLRVGELKPYQRLIAQRNALLRALIRQVRRDKKLSAAPAILAIMTALADNEHGRATISNERLARVLGRDRSNIERCIKALRDDGFLMREPVPGSGTVTWIPVVEFDLTTKPHEMVQALAPATASQSKASRQLPALIAGGSSEVPAINAGSSAVGTRAHDRKYPRSNVEVPALDPYNNDEVVGEFDTNTTLNNTAHKNTAGAQARSATDDDFDLGEEGDLSAEEFEAHQERQREAALKMGKQVWDLLETTQCGEPATAEPLLTKLRAELSIFDPTRIDFVTAVGFSVYEAPHLTIGELLDAVAYVSFTHLIAKQGLDALASTLRRLPENGLVSSCKLAEQFRDIGARRDGLTGRSTSPAAEQTAAYSSNQQN